MIPFLAAAAMLAGSWKWSLPVDLKPSQFIAADMNGDRRPDLVIAGEKDGLAVYLNDGPGRFKPGGRVADAGNASEVAALDFNHDGHMDVATADHDTFRVLLFAGDGKGGLTKAATIRAKTTGKPHVHGLLTAGDGLLYVSSEEGEVVPLLNDGKGHLTPGKVLRTPTPWNPVAGDVNRDGHPDLVAGTFDGKQVHVWLGDGRGAFTAAPGGPHEVFPRVFTTKLADLDGDGHVDIYTCHDDHGRVTVLRGNGKGGFTQMAGSPLNVGPEAYGVQAFDFNADKLLDLLAISLKGDLILFRQTKPGVFASQPETVLQEAGSYRMLTADFDGDGVPVLAIAHPDLRGIFFIRSHR